MTNPFEVLHLDPSAAEEDVVRQAESLRQRATEETAVAAIRQAAVALTGKPEDRQLFALLTHPRPAGASVALERFAAAFRRAPAATLPVEPGPESDRDHFRRLLRSAGAGELNLPPGVFEPVASADDADELQRQWTAALWQSLLFDPRA